MLHKDTNVLRRGDTSSVMSDIDGNVVAFDATKVTAKA